MYAPKEKTDAVGGYSRVAGNQSPGPLSANRKREDQRLDLDIVYPCGLFWSEHRLSAGALRREVGRGGRCSRRHIDFPTYKIVYAI